MKNKKAAGLVPDFLIHSEIYFLIITDKEGKHNFVNKALAKSQIFNPKDFQNALSFDTPYSKDGQNYTTLFSCFLQHPEKSIQLDTEHLDTLNKKLYLIKWEISLLRDEKQEILGLVCVGHQKTAIQRNDATLQKINQNLNNKLKAIIDSTTDGNVLISPDFKVLIANKMAQKRVKEIYGKQLKEGDDFKQYIIKGTEDDFMTDFKKALKGESVKVEKELFIEHGATIWIEAYYFPVYNHLNELIGVTFNSTDITERKKTEEKLKQSEYMLNAIYDSSTDANSFISTDYKILYMNRVAIQMIEDVFQKTPQIGDDYFDYLLPKLHHKFRKNFEKICQGETIIEEEENKQQWFQFSSFPVYDAQGKLVGIADNVRNITDKKLSEIHIQKQNKRLADIAWNQAHEVRRHVANILGLISILRMSESEEEMNTYLDLLEQTGKELDIIIHKIVDYTKNID